MSNQIEITIDSERLTPQQFLEAAQSFLMIVQGVGKNIAGHSLDWTVEVERGSARLRMLPDRDTSEYGAAIGAIESGLRAVSSGVRQMPVGFGQAEMKGLRVLANLRQAQGMREIAIKNGAKAQPISANIIPIIDLIITREKHEEFGSIEGTVLNISLRQGFICTMQDPIEKREILCYLQNQECQDNVLEAVSKRARILADGLIHYSQEGLPVSITADYVRVFRDESELPTLADVQSVYKLYQ